MVTGGWVGDRPGVPRAHGHAQLPDGSDPHGDLELQSVCRHPAAALDRPITPGHAVLTCGTAVTGGSTSSKAKLKCVLSTLYHHAIRHEWLTFNPISRVRTSQKRLRDKDVLTPEEFQELVQQLSVRDGAMVLLIGSTGLRRSEMIALTWSDLNMRTMEVNVLRSCVRNRVGKTKTDASCPVPLHPLVLNALLEWRQQSS
jgi:integrase